MRDETKPVDLEAVRAAYASAVAPEATKQPPRGFVSRRSIGAVVEAAPALCDELERLRAERHPLLDALEAMCIAAHGEPRHHADGSVVVEDGCPGCAARAAPRGDG